LHPFRGGIIRDLPADAFYPARRFQFSREIGKKFVSKKKKKTPPVLWD